MRWPAGPRGGPDNQHIVQYNVATLISPRRVYRGTSSTAGFVVISTSSASAAYCTLHRFGAFNAGHYRLPARVDVARLCLGAGRLSIAQRAEAGESLTLAIDLCIFALGGATAVFSPASGIPALPTDRGTQPGT